MNSRIVDTSSSPLSSNCIIHMALLLWGLAWFAMSVVIFALGWILPPLRSKPPPLVVKPRSPRIRSEPLPPVTATTDFMCLDKDDIVSTTSALSDFRSPPPAPAPAPSTPPSSKRSLFKPRWSFSAARKSSRPSSRKSSVGSAGSLTLVDNDSPPRYVPDLPLIGSESGTEVWLDQDIPYPDNTSPSDSPRSARNVRIQSLKLLKTLSRKVSSKQRPAAVPSPSASPEVPIVPLAHEFCEPVKPARRSQSKERPAPSTLAPSDELRPQQRVDSLTGEVFTTTFVNPFRIKPRKPKAPTNPPLSSTPAPRRASGPRRMLNSLHLTLANNNNASHTPPPVGPAPDSPRSSISSASTSTFSASSNRSAFSGSSGSPRGVRRTQPYAAPYYAAMPGTAARRRAASCSREWRPEHESVEEESSPGEGEDANALGLEFESEFGQMRRGSTPEVQTEPHRGRNGAGHRAAASESIVVLGSVR
ncbi:hypothetical protein LXA43DRAFT_886210 [Ganoderma leucocontextum]|nr:hypothetical protein LXA43DRAFT_886210 [Ganoderma leucocontextum]